MVNLKKKYLAHSHRQSTTKKRASSFSFSFLPFLVGGALCVRVCVCTFSCCCLLDRSFGFLVLVLVLFCLWKKKARKKVCVQYQ